MTVTAPQPHTARTAHLRSPKAARLRRPSWRDPRLLIGLILVAGSVVLGAKVVYANTDTQLYYVAGRTLTPGTVLTETDLNQAPVNLTDAAGHYLPAQEPVPPGTAVLSTVGAGELITRDALGAADEVTVRPIGMPITNGSATGLSAGDIVDIWVAQPNRADPGTFAEPRTVVTSAIVAAVAADPSRFGAGGAVMTSVLVPQESVSALLGSVANEAQISLVAVVGAQPCSK